MDKHVDTAVALRECDLQAIIEGREAVAPRISRTFLYIRKFFWSDIFELFDFLGRCACNRVLTWVDHESLSLSLSFLFSNVMCLHLTVL